MLFMEVRLIWIRRRIWRLGVILEGGENHMPCPDSDLYQINDPYHPEGSRHHITMNRIFSKTSNDLKGEFISTNSTYYLSFAYSLIFSIFCAYFVSMYNFIHTDIPLLIEIYSFHMNTIFVYIVSFSCLGQK